MPDDEALQRVIDGRTWKAFCAALESAGEEVLREGTPTDAADRAEGWRYLTRLLRAGLDAFVEHGDPRRPGLYQFANETIKIGNDNPDNCYWNSTLRGDLDYRIRGRRGSVHYISFGTKAGALGADGQMLPTGEVEISDLHVEPDGSFELWLSSRDPGDGRNWLPMTPETTSLVIRQTFLDRSKEEPAELRIECVNAPDDVPDIDPRTIEQQLLRAAGFAKGTARTFVDWMEQHYARHVNQLPSDDQARCIATGGDASIHYLQSRWELGPDEALLVEPERIPRCKTWNFQLSNYWMESLDYRHHRIHVNKHTAAPEPDGSVRIVVAHRDPGPAWPNWLTTTGHRRGGMLFRWVEADEHPAVHTRVVPFDELARCVRRDASPGAGG